MPNKTWSWFWHGVSDWSSLCYLCCVCLFLMVLVLFQKLTALCAPSISGTSWNQIKYLLTLTGVSSSFTQSMLKVVCLVPHSGAGATMSGMPLASFLNHCKVENVLYVFFLVLQLFHYCAFSFNSVTSMSALTTVKKVLSNVSTQRTSRSTGGWFLLNWEEF